MKRTTDYSYGVVPLFKATDGWQVLLVHQFGRTGAVFWGFPKGHAEGKESGPEAARRELLEETGVELASLDTEHTFKQHYTFQHEGTLIDKTVTYYIGYAASPALALPENDHEIDTGKWCSFKEAQELLTHDTSQRLFAKVSAHVEKHHS